MTDQSPEPGGSSSSTSCTETEPQTESQTESQTDTDAAETFASKIADRFDVVCFDMDQCAVRRHSRGRLLRTEIESFAQAVSPDFVRAVPALLRRGVKLAIVTHSDLAQHGPSKPRRGPDAVLLGDELVQEVLVRTVPEHAHEFFVVAWRPKSRGDEGIADPGKTRHMRTCAAFYGVPIERCVLLDDDPTNCILTTTCYNSSSNTNTNTNTNSTNDNNNDNDNTTSRGGDEATFVAYKCNPEKGFRFSDVLSETASSSSSEDYFTELPDGSIDRLGRWDVKWNLDYKGNPRFQLPEANPNLVRWYGNGNGNGNDSCIGIGNGNHRFDPPLELPILVPLCGKTVDLRWLRDTAGHRCVVGVEGVAKAIEELRDEQLGDLRCTDGTTNGRLWTTAAETDHWFVGAGGGDGDGDDEIDECETETEFGRVISIVRDDFFGLTPGSFCGESSQTNACFGSVYDRAAIVAVPPHSRPQYVEVLDALLVPGGTILMVTVDTQRGENSGPPFAVTPGVVEELFATRGYATELLDEHDAGFGNSGAKEYVFLLTKPL